MCIHINVSLKIKVKYFLKFLMLETTLNFIHITFSQCLIVNQDFSLSSLSLSYTHLFIYFNQKHIPRWDLRMLIRHDYLITKSTCTRVKCRDTAQASTANCENSSLLNSYDIAFSVLSFQLQSEIL